MSDSMRESVWEIERAFAVSYPDKAAKLAQRDALLAALKVITKACEVDFTSEATATCTDDEGVSVGSDGESALTFGMIRRARLAIAKAEHG